MKKKCDVKKRLQALSGICREKWNRIPRKTRRLQALCLLAAMLLAAVSYMAGLGASPVQNGNELPRMQEGGRTGSYALTVNGLLADEALEVEVEVSPKRYSREAADALFREIVRTMEERIIGENDNLSAVSRDLRLIESIPELGVRLLWDYTPYLEGGDAETQRAYFKKYSRLIESDGTVRNEDFAEDEEVSGYLSVVLETYIQPDGEAQYEEKRYKSEPFQIFVYVVPRKLTEEERLKKLLFQSFEQADKQNYGSDSIQLPESVAGRKLQYTGVKDNSYLLFPVLGVAAAAALSLRETATEKERRKKRQAQLLLDYSELVSKLMVYIGAGLTVRSAFEKISLQYDAAAAEQGQKPRALQEELRICRNQLEMGIPESSVYLDFSKRINLKPYTKLCSLIEQNRKNGSKNLKLLLDMEMTEAFEQRKSTAKRLGEEAGTKLLLPLFLMLGIVMVIVIVPAMMALG